MVIAMMRTGNGPVMPVPSIPLPITNRLVAKSETPEKSCISAEGVAPFEVTQSAAEWAAEQWGSVELGDARLNRRAVQIGASMATHPSQSLPHQMGDRAALRAAYGMLNHPGVTLEQLSEPHWKQTRQAAGQHEVVLFVQDTTELDYTHHPTKKGVGPIGNNKGQGLLLHSTLGVVPGATPQILGVAHQQVVLRRPADQPRPKYTGSAEGQVWAKAAEAVGAPPERVLWVHVGDRGSDDFRFMHTCRDKHFLIRVARNRILEWENEEVGPEMRKLVDFAGWDMPINYGSQLEEHKQVRTDAGMFDVSHMTVVDLTGDRTREFLRYLLANNVDRLKDSGKALYSCMLNESGGVIDDLIVYFLQENFFRMVVNAGTHDKDIA